MLPVQVFSAYNKDPESSQKDYNYCPLCGTNLETRARKQCPACGWTHYRNPSPGVVVVITKGDRILLGKRGSSSFAPHKWCLPGGYIEFDEDFLSAGLREVHEETGLQVEIQSILSVVSNFLSPDLHTLVVILHATIVGGHPVPGDDLCELEWFSLEGPFPEFAFEADQHIIERFQRTNLQGAPIDPQFSKA